MPCNQFRLNTLAPHRAKALRLALLLAPMVLATLPNLA